MNVDMEPEMKNAFFFAPSIHNSDTFFLISSVQGQARLPGQEGDEQGSVPAILHFFLNAWHIRKKGGGSTAKYGNTTPPPMPNERILLANKTSCCQRNDETVSSNAVMCAYLTIFQRNTLPARNAGGGGCKMHTLPKSCADPPNVTKRGGGPE